jgi:type IV pilus assembly protein PilN
MIKINLLPIREIKRRKKAKTELSLFGFGMVILLGLLVLGLLVQMMLLNKIDTDLQAVRVEKAKYAKILTKMAKLKQDQETLARQIDIIDALKATSSITVHVLDDVARLTPENRIWLTSLTQEQRSLTIEGMALDNQTVAKYMDDLRQSPYIQDVNLTSSTMKEFEGRNLKAFSVGCALNMPDIPQMEADAGNTKTKK